MTAAETERVRDYLVTDHAAVVDAIRDCTAASAAASTDDTGRSDTSAVRRGTETRLRTAGVWAELPTVLAGCVRRTGNQLSAVPVAAPPYVAATATGVVLRATVDAGRLVVSVDPLVVDRGDDGGTGVRLRPRDVPRADLVCVEWR